MGLEMGPDAKGLGMAGAELLIQLVIRLKS